MASIRVFTWLLLVNLADSHLELCEEDGCMRGEDPDSLQLLQRDAGRGSREARFQRLMLNMEISDFEDKAPTDITKMIRVVMVSASTMAICGVAVLALTCMRSKQLDDSPEKGAVLAEARETSMLGKMGLFFWACAVGVSVSLDGKSKVILNNHSRQPQMHAVQVPFLVMAFALVPLSVASFVSRAEMKSPPPRACFAGACTLSSFASVLTSAYVGFQVTFIVQLLGTMCMSALVDFMSKDVLTGTRVIGVLCVFVSAGLLIVGDLQSTTSTQSEELSGRTKFLCMVLVAVTGAGFVVQASGNAALKEALGSPFRVALLCNVVTMLCWAPMLAVANEPMQMELSDWPLWVYSVAQNIFYISSMSVIPKHLSYGATFVSVISGQLITATVLDMLDASDGSTMVRSSMGILLALLGAYLSVPAG